ncbi:hypothetical protein C8J56DRAFT_1032801 [Mycena floridula]|nr:hypothetical protein C8J56DRAFT_1032801 [Mycena floridula]
MSFIEIFSVFRAGFSIECSTDEPVPKNAGGDIFRYNGSSNHWTKISGALKRISAGSRTNVWGVNAAGNIYRYTGDDSNPWVQIPGALTDIGAGDSKHWVQIPGALTAISAGVETNVWGVNSAGNIYTSTGDDAKPWVQVAGGLVDIGAGTDGTVWGVNSAGNIYRWIRD